MPRRGKLDGQTQVGRWYKKGDRLLLEIRYRRDQKAVPQPYYFKFSQVIGLRPQFAVNEPIARELWPWAFKKGS